MRKSIHLDTSIENKHHDRSRVRLMRKEKIPFPLLFEQEPLHFCFELGFNNYVASLEYINKPAFVFNEIINLYWIKKFYIKVSLSPSTLPPIPTIFSEYVPLTNPMGSLGNAICKSQSSVTKNNRARDGKAIGLKKTGPGCPRERRCLHRKITEHTE